MPEAAPGPIFDALRLAQGRSVFPTAMGSAELRGVDAAFRARSVFMAHGINARYLTIVQGILEELAAGDIGESSARAAMLDALKALGYTPEGGFPDTPPGQVPPAVRGSLQDLSSFRRLDLIVRTQLDLMRGAGLQWRGHTPDRLEAFPAWELIRIEPKTDTRKWWSRWLLAEGSEEFFSGNADASDLVGEPTGMIALKGAPIWGELGSSENFPDALDVDYPPFAYNSGVWWREVSRAECIALGILGPDGETIEQFHRGPKRPLVMVGELPLPAPSLSMKDVAPELVADFQKVTKAKPAKKNPAVFDFSAILEADLEESAAAYQKANPKYKP